MKTSKRQTLYNVFKGVQKETSSKQLVEKKYNEISYSTLKWYHLINYYVRTTSKITLNSSKSILLVSMATQFCGLFFKPSTTILSTQDFVSKLLCTSLKGMMAKTTSALLGVKRNSPSKQWKTWTLVNVLELKLSGTLFHCYIINPLIWKLYQNYKRFLLGKPSSLKLITSYSTTKASMKMKNCITLRAL